MFIRSGMQSAAKVLLRIGNIYVVNQPYFTVKIIITLLSHPICAHTNLIMVIFRLGGAV